MAAMAETSQRSLSPVPPANPRSSTARRPFDTMRMTTTTTPAPTTEAPPPGADLRKVAALLTDPNAVELRERHLHALAKVAKRKQAGYRPDELPAVAQLVNALVHRAGAAAPDEAMGEACAACIAPLAPGLLLLNSNDGNSDDDGSTLALPTGRDADQLRDTFVQLAEALSLAVASPAPALSAAALQTLHAWIAALPGAVWRDADAALALRDAVQASMRGPPLSGTLSLRRTAAVPAASATATSAVLHIGFLQAQALLICDALIPNLAALLEAPSSERPARATHADSSGRGSQSSHWTTAPLAVEALAWRSNSSLALHRMAQASVAPALCQSLPHFMDPAAGADADLALDVLRELLLSDRASGAAMQQCRKLAVGRALLAAHQRTLVHQDAAVSLAHRTRACGGPDARSCLSRGKAPATRR
jgi:hypothetical protein